MRFILSYFLIVIIFSSCQEKDNYENLSASESNPLIVSEIPDSVQTGIPILCQPTIINPDSVRKPIITSLLETRKDSSHSNIIFLDSTFSFVSNMVINENNDPIKIDTAIPNLIPCLESKPIQLSGTKYMESAQYDLQYIDIDEGINSSYFWSIIEDSNGQIWFASHDAGVSKFNGNSFSTYTKENGLCENSIRYVYEDSKGNIWFCSKGSGISIYNGEYFEHYNDDNGLSNSQIEVVFEDSKGNIWIGTDGMGVSMFDGTFFHHYTMENGICHPIIRSICELDNGDIWFGSGGGGISSFNGEEFKDVLNEDGFMSENVRTMLKDNKGNIWIGTIGKGILKFDGSNFTRITQSDGLLHNTIYSLTEDFEGGIWFGSESGLTRLYQDKLIHFTDKNGVRNNSIRCLLTDSQGDIWFGTWGGGIHRLRINSFEHYTTTSGLPNNRITAITQDHNGTHWFGTHRFGVAKYDGNQYEYITRDNGLAQNTVFCNYEDSKNNMWFGTLTAGVCKFDGNEFITYNNGSGLNSRGIFDIIEGSDGKIYMGTNGGGVNIFDGYQFSHITEAEGLSDDIIRALEIDKNGDLWIGTWSMGLCKYDGKNITYITTKEGLSSKHIFSLEIDANGLIWVGTDMGVDVINPNEKIVPNTNLFKHFDIKNGISNNSVTGITSDMDGNIWLATKKGLTFIRLSNDEEIIQSVHTFNKEDGLLSTDFFNHSIFVDKDNVLWAGSGRSLAKLDINKLNKLDIPPSVQLFGLEINQEFLDYRQIDLVQDYPYNYDSVQAFYNYPINLNAPYNHNHFTFHFSSSDWTAGHKIFYSYKMEGLSESWSIPSNESIADYRNLPHGEYTFKVKSSYDKGQWSDEFHYSFKINPPWWHTWWARSLYIILIILVLIGYVRWKTNKHKQRQKELESEVDIATKEIREQKKEVENQKEQIEEAHKEITDSIAYAKRIQNAILPAPKIVDEYLRDSFILYKPKDVVAGDFYWMQQQDDHTLFAAADCTGHGVPGAMVSVVCNNALNRAVREYGLLDPGDILDKTREIVVAEFEKSEDNVKDGMDIALCSIHNNRLLYSGAHNPLLIIRNGEILETKGNKQPIGKFMNAHSFDTHVFELQKADTIYIYTDGYIDQFGGEKGKKLKSKAFKELLLSIQSNSMKEQLNIIDTKFESWRGNLEQIDDVCVIGVRV